MADLLRLMEESGAVLKGHFLLTSGRHSDTYFEKFRILERPGLVSEVCDSVVDRFRNLGAELIVGPTIGGIIIAFEVARRLDLPALYVERVDGKRMLARSAKLRAGTRALVVDDVLTTGKTIRELMELVCGENGEVCGVGVLIDRSETTLDFGVPLYSAVRVEAVSYAPDEVPEWLAAIPITKPGTG